MIRLQDEAGQDKAAWELTKAWPCKYDPTDLNGKGNEVAIDTSSCATRASSGSSERGGTPRCSRPRSSSPSRRATWTTRASLHRDGVVRLATAARSCR